MSNNNMYDELAPLFGVDKNDKRIRLFLHLFLGETARSKQRIIYHSELWGQKSGVRKSDIDPELAVFGVQLGENIEKSNKSTNQSVKDENLRILNKYSSKANAYKVLGNLVGAEKSPEGKVYNKIYSDVSAAKVMIATLLGFASYREMVSIASPYEDELKSSKAFTYKIDKLTAQTMLEEAKNELTPIGSASTFLASLDTPSNTDTYFRDAKDPSKLFTKDNSGNLVEVTRGSQTFWEASKDNCAGFHVAKGSKEACTDYLLECINGSDPTQCRNYMAEPAFWGDSENGIKEEIKQMLPAMALTTLEKFGFKQVNVIDSVAKKSLNKVESVNSWLQRLEKDMTDAAEFEPIKKNTNLTLYLNLLVDKINSSPHILNENIVQSEETQPYNPSKFNGQLLSTYGLRPKLPSGSNVVSSIARLSDTMRYGLAASAELQPRVIVAVNPGFSMRGGAVVQEDYKFTAVELENQYNLLKNMLKAHSKEIDASNDAELRRLFTSFKTTENKLWQTIKIMDKYVQLMDGFAYNDPNKILNLETLNEIVKAHEHQLTKTGKKQETLVQALQALADVVQEAVNKPSVNKPSVNGVPTSAPFTHHN